MSIIITCDVCNNPMDERLIVVSLANSQNDTDICSAQCLHVLASYLTDEEEPTATEEVPDEAVSLGEVVKKVKKLTPLAPKERYPTEQETSDITGVVKRW